MRRIQVEHLHTVIDTALASGGRRKSLYVTEWSIAGDCTDPYYTEVWGRPLRMPGQKALVIKRGLNTPQILELWTRCRKCERCLRARSRRWYGAALAETKASTRTWFGTLTLSPENHYKAYAYAAGELAKQGVVIERLSADDQFMMRHKAIGLELTKMIKRIRKNSGAALRYLLVAERHASGLPHYHVLLHEQPLGGQVPHRILSESWDLGFERWRLSDPQNPRSAAYVCKYLSKSLAARVRASQGYGATDRSARPKGVEIPKGWEIDPLLLELLKRTE